MFIFSELEFLFYLFITYFSKRKKIIVITNLYCLQCSRLSLCICSVVPHNNMNLHTRTLRLKEQPERRPQPGTKQNSQDLSPHQSSSGAGALTHCVCYTNLRFFQLRLDITFSLLKGHAILQVFEGNFSWLQGNFAQ